MDFKLTLTEYLDEPEWSSSRFMVSDDFYNVEVSGNDPDEITNHVKGIILCAVSQRPTLSDNININFVIEEKYERYKTISR